MKVFDVNMDKAIELTAKLEKLHRSAFPVAVRQTLNDVAFQTKSTVPEIASKMFITRQKSFFRAFTIVDKATGFEVNKMKSSTGISSLKGDIVAEGLEKQEKGGVIKGRKLIPHNQSRISGSHRKKVSRRNLLSNVNLRDNRYVLIKKGSKGTVFEVKNQKSGRRLKPLYHYRAHRNSKVKASPFMSTSARISSKQMPSFYKRNAERQFKRLLK